MDKEGYDYNERMRWVFFGIPWTFTTYHLRDDMVTIREGFFKRVENDCYMYKIVDVELTRTLMERMFGLGTIHCFTGDTTHTHMDLKHIKNSKEIKEYILKASEEARIKRRTVNMLDIGSGDIGDGLDMHGFNDVT